jgi:hypothetical protein
VIASARVSAKGTPTGKSTETQSDSSGKYRIANLARGEIDRPGFLTFPIRNEVPVHVDMTWRPM